MSLKGVSFVAFLVLVAAAVFLVQRRALVASGVPLVAVQLAAVALMVWARITFGARSFHATANPTAGGLVTTGPYRFLRHPIYAAILYFLTAGVLSHLALANVALLAVAVGAVWARIMAEERLVAERYPEYAAYAARTRRLIPYVL